MGKIGVLTIALMIYGNTVNAFPVVNLKSASVYSSYSYVAQDGDEISSIINFDNVAVIRNLPDNAVLVDGRVNIKFSSQQERDVFIKSYYDYIGKRDKLLQEQETKSVAKNDYGITKIELPVLSLIMSLAMGVGWLLCVLKGRK